MKKLIAFAALILLASAAQAADVPVGVAYRDFSGGLNNFAASVSLTPNESPKLLNVVIDEPPGALTQRNGYLTCGQIPSGNTATNLYEFSRNDGSRNLIATDNNAIWATSDCTNWVLISTGLPSTSLPRFATINNNLWIVNGHERPIVWNGVSTSTLNGANGMPLAPIAKYIAYWKGRVWLGSSAVDPSGVYFSALVDDGGNILDPETSTSAWSNVNNLIYFDRDDGSPIYGLKIYRDNMYVFKETGIDRLVFESEFTIGGISTAKTVSKTGSKFQESIVEMDDGILRFLGRDGVYRFDGSTVQRISTKWTPTFYQMKQPSHSEVYSIWDTAARFYAGTIDSTHHVFANAAGGIQLSTSTPVAPNGSLQTGDTTGWTTNSGQTIQYVSASGSYNYLAQYGVLGQAGISCATPSHQRPIYHWELWTSTGLYQDLSSVCTGGNGDCIPPVVVNVNNTIGMYGQLHIISGDCAGYYLRSPTITDNRTQLRFDSGTSIGFNINGQLLGVYFGMDLSPYTPSTGTYISDVINASGVSRWETFDVYSTLNGGTLNFFVRTAPTNVALPVAAWRSITPGIIISTTTDGWMQWMVNFTGYDNTTPPVINSVSANWATGDNTKSPVNAINYKSRYWIAASTTPGNNYNDLVMVENKTMGASVPGLNYTQFNIPASAFTLWHNNLYAAISNTPNIARLDYGQTDDGNAILSYWQSRDEIDQNPLFYKTVNKQIVDFASTPANSALQVGLSSDEGGTWQYRTVNTGMKPSWPRNTYVVNPSTITMSLQYRSQILNNTMGVGYTVYGLHAFGTGTEFYGNGK